MSETKTLKGPSVNNVVRQSGDRGGTIMGCAHRTQKSAKEGRVDLGTTKSKTPACIQGPPKEIDSHEQKTKGTVNDLKGNTRNRRAEALKKDAQR